MKKSKSIAIINTPNGCANCVFGVCSYKHPWWSSNKEKRNRKAYYCQLDEAYRLLEMDINDETTKAGWCPLKPYKEG